MGMSLHCLCNACNAHAMKPSQGGREETNLHLCRRRKGLHILGGWWPWPSKMWNRAEGGNKHSDMDALKKGERGRKLFVGGMKLKILLPSAVHFEERLTVSQSVSQWSNRNAGDRGRLGRRFDSLGWPAVGAG